MKTFIRENLRVRLSELEFSRHAYERAEERVWGTDKLTFGGYNEDPPSLNKNAWLKSDVFNKATVRTATSGDMEIPVTDAVRTIIGRLNFLKNDLTVNVSLGKIDGKIETIILLVEHFNMQHRGGGIWGSELTAVVGPGGNVLSIDWRNPIDLSSLKSGKFDYCKYVVSVAYLIKNNIKELNDDNIADIAMYPKKEKANPNTPNAPREDKFKKLKLTNGTVVKFFPNSNKFKSMNDEDLDYDTTFELLAPEVQDFVFSNLKQ